MDSLRDGWEMISRKAIAVERIAGTHPLCVRLILSAMRGAMSMVPILPSVASTLAV